MRDIDTALTRRDRSGVADAASEGRGAFHLDAYADHTAGGDFAGGDLYAARDNAAVDQDAEIGRQILPLSLIAPLMVLSLRTAMPVSPPEMRLLLRNPPVRKVLLVMVTPPAPIVPAFVTPPLKVVPLMIIALV